MGFSAVILAAGAASRMGSAKQILYFQGQSLIRRAASAAVGAGCAPVVVVLGAHAELTRGELGGLPVVEVVNDGWESGLASSIVAGVRAVIAASPATDGAVITVCDQPFVTAQTISLLAACSRKNGRRLVASSYGGSFGVPALFPRSFFGELIALQGSAGAKQVIARHANGADFLEFAGGEVDIDTPADFRRLIALEAPEPEFRDRVTLARGLSPSERSGQDP